jgi:proline dehydrogenase
MLFRTLILKTAGSKAVQKLVTGSKLFRPLVRRFVAGETLDEAMDAAETQADQGLMSTLDLLGENVSTLEEANLGLEAYIEVVERIAQSRHKELINISIKLTALGLDQDTAIAEQNLRTLLSRAEQNNIFVRVDMEASDYTELTVAMIERVWDDHKLVGTVMQSMMKRMDSDINRLLKLGARMRIVKGAYLEGPEVAIQDKAEVDQAYIDGAKRLLKEGTYPAIATHDQAIVETVSKFVKEQNIEPATFEWQMLYGIRRDLQASLKQQGHNVRIYIPYGSQWYPYFSRRLAERPANVFFIIKTLFKDRGKSLPPAK